MGVIYQEQILERYYSCNVPHIYSDNNCQVSMPLLVVGTKADVASGSKLPLHTRRSDIAEEMGTEEIHLNCNDRSSIAAGSSAATKLTRFFDKVVCTIES